ncbi:hypothetical protein ABFS82_03G015500 [Erythranthe guttata]
MKMKAKKKLSTIKEPTTKSEPLIAILRGSRESINSMCNLGATKSWLRETSTSCGGDHRRLPSFPQLHLLDDTQYYSLRYNNYTVVEVVVSQILPTNYNDARIPSRFGRVVEEYSGNIPDLLLTGIARPSFVAYNWNPPKEGQEYSLESTLIKYECKIIDPFDTKKRPLQFTSLVNFEGVFFALSLQGALVVMQEIDSRLTISAISSSRAVPSISCRHFKEYIALLDGEIFVVFLIHEKRSEVVDRVEVFRLSFPDLKWIKVESINGKILFLDQSYLNLESAESNSRKNCIYFTDHGSDHNWWIYEMETGCILPTPEHKKY